MYLSVSYGSQNKQQLEDGCLLLGCYTASTGNSLPMSQDNLSVSSSRVNKQRLFHYIALTNLFYNRDRLFQLDVCIVHFV